MEITLLAGRNINLLVGIFTLTGKAVRWCEYIYTNIYTLSLLYSALNFDLWKWYMNKTSELFFFVRSYMGWWRLHPGYSWSNIQPNTRRSLGTHACALCPDLLLRWVEPTYETRIKRATAGRVQCKYKALNARSGSIRIEACPFSHAGIFYMILVQASFDWMQLCRSDWCLLSSHSRGGLLNRNKKLMSALMSLTTQLSPLQCLEEESSTFVCFILHPGGANEGPVVQWPLGTRGAIVRGSQSKLKSMRELWKYDRDVSSYRFSILTIITLSYPQCVKCINKMSLCLQQKCYWPPSVQLPFPQTPFDCTNKSVARVKNSTVVNQFRILTGGNRCKQMSLPLSLGCLLVNSPNWQTQQGIRHP